MTQVCAFRVLFWIIRKVYGDIVTVVATSITVQNPQVTGMNSKDDYLVSTYVISALGDSFEKCGMQIYVLLT